LQIARLPHPARFCISDARANRGMLTEPGRNSRFRDRTVAENLDLFHLVRTGEFANGARVAAPQDRHGVLARLSEPEAAECQINHQNGAISFASVVV
jgi:hypothetical protein